MRTCSWMNEQLPLRDETDEEYSRRPQTLRRKARVISRPLRQIDVVKIMSDVWEQMKKERQKTV